MTTTDTTPGSGNHLLHQIATERSTTTDPARRAQLYQIEMGVHMWKDRDAAVATVLRLAPSPTLPCPTWCELDPGHHWTDYDSHGDLDEGSPERVVRYHERSVVALDDVQVDLSRADALDLEGDLGEHVKWASHTNVEVGAGGAVDVDETGKLARALHEAHTLLVKAREAGDPRRGALDGN